MIEERPESQIFGELASGLLASGLEFRFQARGRSMLPLINDGEMLHVQRANSDTLKVSDIVLFRQGAEFKAHRIISKQKNRFVTRGDAGLEADEAIQGEAIVGKIVAKECAKSGRIVSLEGLRGRCSFFAREVRARATRTVRRMLPSGFALAALLFSFLHSLPERLPGGAETRQAPKGSNPARPGIS
jgi:hypothetical protein